MLCGLNSLGEQGYPGRPGVASRPVLLYSEKGEGGYPGASGLPGFPGPRGTVKLLPAIGFYKNLAFSIPLWIPLLNFFFFFYPLLVWLQVTKVCLVCLVGRVCLDSLALLNRVKDSRVSLGSLGDQVHRASLGQRESLESWDSLARLEKG